MQFKLQSKIDLIYLLLIVSTLFLILASFMNVINSGYDELNLYGQLEGLLMPTLFLASMIVELCALLTGNQKLLISLKLLNTFWIFILLSQLTGIVSASQASANRSNKFAIAFNIGMTVFTGFNPSLSQTKGANLTSGYLYIRYAAIFSVLVLLVYLYLYFVKKERHRFSMKLPVLSIQDVLVSYYKNRLVTIASILLLVAPFLKFIALPGYVNKVVPAFATNPYIALIVVLFSNLLVYSTAKNESKNTFYYIVGMLLTFYFFNPFYVLQFGEPGIGYFAYIVGLLILAYHLVDTKFIKH